MSVNERIENKITLGSLAGNLVVNTGGPSWAVYEIDLSQELLDDEETENLYRDIGEVVTAHLLAEVEADEPEKKGPVRLSDAQAEAELRTLGHPIELTDLVGLPGFGDKRATDLMAKWTESGVIEVDPDGSAVFID